MAHKTRKAQVVITALDAQSQSVSYLLLQTNKSRGSFWQNVTGKVDAGESYEEGAVREVIEETSVKPEWFVHFIDLKLAHNFIDGWKRDVHEKSFLLIVDRKFKVKIDPNEHQSHKWVNSIKRSMVKHAGNWEAIEKAQKILMKEYT